MLRKHFIIRSVCIVSSLMIINQVRSQRFEDSDYPWSYRCIPNTLDGPACQREEVDASSNDKVPYNICILTCGPYGGLWPYPTIKTEIGNTLTAFNLVNVIFDPPSLPSNEPTLVRMNTEAQDIFQNYIRAKIPEGQSEIDVPATKLIIHLSINTSVTKIDLDTDESYKLIISASGQDVQVAISGGTFFGTRHALETLAQLIDFNSERKYLQIVNTVNIEDKPAFTYRGLLLDTSRHFIPFTHLRRLIDGISYNKMNIFHWHITDSNSFPFYSSRVPNMVKYGTYSSRSIYYPEDVKEFLQYANQRGVKVIPEVDMPSHAGNGWQWGEKEGLGELSLCVNAEPYQNYCIQPPCGQLNPLNNNTYFLLGELFMDFLETFDNDIFHMGGDEISYRCWLAYPHITEWLEKNNSTDLMDIWGLFQDTALAKLKEANQGQPITAIVWTSEMTNYARQYLNPDDYIIQIWSTATDELSKGIFEEGYRVIFSNNDTVYFDHYYGPWRGNFVNPNVLYKTWHLAYGNDILGQVEHHVGREKMQELYASGKILGGVGALWSEKVDIFNMDQKMWPRGAAYGERLWSNPPGTLEAVQFAYPRLIHHRERLVQRGLTPDTLLPESCYHIWGFCDNLYFTNPLPTEVTTTATTSTTPVTEVTTTVSTSTVTDSSGANSIVHKTFITILIALPVVVLLGLK